MKKALKIFVGACILTIFMCMLTHAATMKLGERTVFKIKENETVTYSFTTTDNESFYRIKVKNLSVNDRVVLTLSNKYDEVLLNYDYWANISKGTEKLIDLKLDKKDKFTFSVSVNNKEQSGNVELTVTEIQDDVKDTRDEAEEVKIKQSVVRVINAEKDVDCFKFTTTPNDSFYKVSLKNLSINDRIVMTIYDCYDSEVLKYDYWTNVSRGVDKVTDIKFNPNEEYTVEISVNSQAQTGNYSFCVTEVIDDVPDTKENSTLLESDITYVASLDAEQDTDFFKWVADSTTLKLELLNITVNDRLLVTVYDEYDAEVAKFDYWSNVSKGSTKSLEAEVEKGKSYWICIKSNSFAQIGDYKVTIGKAKKTIEILPVDYSKLVNNAICLTIDKAEIDVYGVAKPLDVPAKIINSRTMVPLRAIFEALGASVEWDDSTKTVTSVRGKTTVKLTIGKTEIIVNGKATKIDVPAQIVNNRTLVPVRAVAEAFGCKVEWDDATRTVKITE